MKDTSMQLLRIGGLKLSTDSFVAFFCRGSEGQREFKKLSFKFEQLPLEEGLSLWCTTKEPKLTKEVSVMSWREGRLQIHEVLPSKPKFRLMHFSVPRKSAAMMKKFAQFQEFQISFQQKCLLPPLLPWMSSPT